MKRKVYMAVVLVGVLIAGATLAYWGQDVNDEPRVFDEKRVYLERFREAVKNADTDLFFYGRVMDQYGLPVDGAKVTLSYDHYLPSSFWGLWLTEMTVITDTEGKFTISGIRGSALRIKEIAKDGYEFLRFGKWNPQLVFHYTLTPETSPSNIFVPDPANPVEFRLRKRGETTLLLLNRWIQGPVFRFLQRNRVWQYDLVRQVHRWTDGDPNARLFNGEPFNPDLQVQAVYDGDTSPPKWTVAIGSGLPGGGIVAS